MPKKIKSAEFTAEEKRHAILGVVVMAVSLGLCGSLGVLLSELAKDDSGGGAFAIVTFVFYVLYVVLTLTHCVQGVKYWSKKENYGVLCTSALTGFGALSALINIQLALAMLFSTLKMDDAAKNVIGDNSFPEFIAAQHSAWVLMIVGTAAAMLAGTAAIVKLVKNIGKR